MSRILAVDWGARRVGLAVSDPTQTLVRPLPTLTISHSHDAVRGVLETVRNEAVEKVVVGLPLNMDGGEGPSVKKAKALGAALEQAGLFVVYHDERMTTESAKEYLSSRGDRRPEKTRLDQVAAILLLENYLATQAHEGGCA